MDFMYVVVVTGCEAFRLKIAEVETPFRGNLMETVMEALRAKNPAALPEDCFSAVWPMDVTVLRPAEMELCSAVPSPTVPIPAVESMKELSLVSEDLLAPIRVSGAIDAFFATGAMFDSGGASDLSTERTHQGVWRELFVAETGGCLFLR